MNRASSRELLFDAAHILCGWRNNVTGEQRNVIEQDVYYPKAFTGIQVLTPAIWENVPLSGKFSIIDLYLHRAKDKCIKAYDHSNDLFIDIGKPEALAIANELFGS